MWNKNFISLFTALVATAAQADLVYDAQPVVVQTQQPVQQVVSAPVAVAAPVAASNEPTLSRSELLRRERLRREMQAEDVLNARMEQLRLREEERRVQQLIAQDTSGQQVVVAQNAAQPMIVTTQAAPVAVVAPEQVSVAPVSAILDVQNEDDLRIAISPRGGISNLATNINPYSLSVLPFYAFGGNISAYSGQFAFDLGYTYSLYGINMFSRNPFVQPLQLQYSQFRQNALEMRQHLFEAGGRFFLTKSKFRPFVGGAVGYSRGYINYSQGVQSILGQFGLLAFNQDYLLEQYIATLQAGIEYKLGQSFSVGFLGKYSFVFSNRESQPFYGFVGGTPVQDIDKMLISNSIATAGFYSFQLGLNIFL